MSNPNPAGYRQVQKAYTLPANYSPPPALTMYARIKIPAAVIISNTKYLQAEKLAPKVKGIHTGIYRVGLSTVSIWRASCTCQARRNNPKTPCVHQIALWLSHHVQTWGGAGRWLMRHNLKYSFEDKPKIVAIYAKIKGYTPHNMQPFKGGFYRVTAAWDDGTFEITGANGEAWGEVYRDDLNTLTPFYAEGGNDDNL